MSSTNPPPGGAIAERTQVQDVVAQIRGDEFRAQLAAALRDGVSVDKFQRVTATALMENPDVVKADRGSLFQSVIKCAQDGLYPDGRDAALVVFGNKVQYMPMIGGFRKIAAEHGWTIRTSVVCANDEFSFTEEPPTIQHRPVPPGSERGDLVAAYAVARHRDGVRREQKVLYAEEVAKRRGIARSKNVWDTWTAQMWEKTAGRDLFAELPLDPSDRERIDRVIDASRLEPVEKAVLMYGPAARESFGELPAGASATGAPIDHPPSTDGVGSTSSSGPETSADPPTASQGDDEFGEEPEASGEGVADEDVEAAQAAAAFTVQISADSWVNGQTLAEINARGDDGQKFYWWALGEKNRNAELRAAVEAYAKVQLPFLYGELVGGES